MATPSQATTTNNARFNAEAAAWDANPDVHRASDGALQALLSVYASSPAPPSSCPPAPPSTPPPQPSRIHLTSHNPQTDVLEIGCGTGLLSFRLAPYVRSILAIDAAEGMISALQAKLASSPSSPCPDNRRPEREQAEPDPKPNARAAQDIITPLCILLTDAEDPRLPPCPTNPPQRMKFDLITSHLVLHHIPVAHIPALLQTMYHALRPGGEVALTDYQDVGPDARKFHPEAKMDGVESPQGINADWFAGCLRDAGFEAVDVSPKWTMDKDVERFPGEWGMDGKKPSGELATMGFPFLLCRGRKP